MRSTVATLVGHQEHQSASHTAQAGVIWPCDPARHFVEGCRSRYLSRLSMLRVRGRTGLLTWRGLVVLCRSGPAHYRVAGFVCCHFYPCAPHPHRRHFINGTQPRALLPSIQFSSQHFSSAQWNSILLPLLQQLRAGQPSNVFAPKLISIYSC